MKHLFKIHIILSLCFSSFFDVGVTVAQTYPVMLNTQLIPPFSGYLPDYSAAGNEKLKVLLTFNDFSKPSYLVKLKIKIDGQGITIQSKPFYFEGPIVLDPGVPLFLSGSDLGNLLNSNNLDFSGISKAQYEQRKVLPEGFYSICITAYDNNNPNPIAVSNTSCAFGMMVLSDPPYLNLPFCGSTVNQTSPQQMVFSWTPINQASPNSAGQTDYVFELFEIRPTGQNPNSIVQTLPPIYTETLSTTSLNYGITEPPLINAMQYVWRVRAVDQSGRDLFKNQGYSQICTFTYGSSYNGANLNINLNAQSVSHRQIKAQWDSLNLYENYLLEFQKVGGTSTWFPINTANARARITGLEPSTNYKLRVKGQLPDGTWGPQSNEVTVSTAATPNYACGEVVTPFNMQGFVPLTNANVLMIWDIGQFEVIVTSLQNPTNASGQYSGTGRVRVGFAGGIPFPVSFKDITVSSDMRIVAGKVEVISRGIDAWLNQMNAGFFNAGNEETEYVTSSTSTVVTVNTGNGTINIGGDSFGFDNTYGNTITNGDGIITVVTPAGQIISVGSTSGTPIPDNKKYINTAVGTVLFNAVNEQLYGYDKFEFTQWNKWYEKTFDIATNAIIPVDWKSLQSKKYDQTEIEIELSSTSLNPDSVFVRTATGTIYTQQKINGKRYIYLVGSENKKSQELFASIRMGDSIVNIGKLNTINYDLQIKTVNIVPFNNTKTLNAIAIQNQLNRAYRQALIKWIVDIKPTLSVPAADWDLNSNNKLNCGSSLFAKYSNEMQNINTKLKAENYYNDGSIYVIACGITPDSLQSGLLGEMPRNRNIGYVFTNSNPSDSLFTQIVAHELGHGYSTLEHTFSEITEGSSNNIMDYPSGLSMARFQWDLCQDPNPLIGLFDGDISAQYTPASDLQLLNTIIKYLKLKRNTKTRLIPPPPKINPTLLTSGIDKNKFYLYYLERNEWQEIMPLGGYYYLIYYGAINIGAIHIDANEFYDINKSVNKDLLLGLYLLKDIPRFKDLIKNFPSVEDVSLKIRISDEWQAKYARIDTIQHFNYPDPTNSFANSNFTHLKISDTLQSFLDAINYDIGPSQNEYVGFSLIELAGGISYVISSVASADLIKINIDIVTKKNSSSISSAGTITSLGSWLASFKMRTLINNWASTYRTTINSNTQLAKFNKACVARWRNALNISDEISYGRNGGILNTQSSFQTISAEKGLDIHPTLLNKLPANTQWPNLANCAECDAVNQALWKGANWGDIQIHTIDIRPDGTLTDVIQCSECLNIFSGMRVTSQ